MMLSILIIDQNPLACIGIQTLVNNALKKAVETHLASSKTELDGLITDLKIDLFVLGLYEKSDIDIFYLKKTIFETHPGSLLIVFYEKFSLESMLTFSQQRGVGFISKPRVKDELGTCLARVLKGEMYMCEDTSQSIINAWTEKRSISARK
jgi:DNA-binding NtrC family response regulator